MKYIAPSYEAFVYEAGDILTLSSEKFTVESTENGKGNIFVNAFDIFN